MSRTTEDPIVIVSAVRTAIGGFQGAFASAETVADLEAINQDAFRARVIDAG